MTPRLAARGAKLVVAGRNAEALRTGLGEPEDVASLVDWLLDRAQSRVTGQVFGVDGGLSKLWPRWR